MNNDQEKKMAETKVRLNNDGTVYDEEKSKHKHGEPCPSCFLVTACDCGEY